MCISHEKSRPTLQVLRDVNTYPGASILERENSNLSRPGSIRGHWEMPIVGAHAFCDT